MNRHLENAWRAGICLLALGAGMHAGAADSEVQRQFQLRDQQQMELRLKMQQQLDRSTRLPQSPSAGLQANTLERDQQQRLQQLNDRQMRGLIPPAAGNAEQMRRELQLQRGALNPGGLESNRFGMERQFGGERQLETIDRGSGP